MEGLAASREDILDLIEEISYLRVTCDLPGPTFPPAKPSPVLAAPVELPDPWAEEWPGNPC